MPFSFWMAQRSLTIFIEVCFLLCELALRQETSSITDFVFAILDLLEMIFEPDVLLHHQMTSSNFLLVGGFAF